MMLMFLVLILLNLNPLFLLKVSHVFLMLLMFLRHSMHYLLSHSFLAI